MTRVLILVEESREKLKCIGRKGQTYDQIITELLKLKEQKGGENMEE